MTSVSAKRQAMDDMRRVAKSTVAAMDAEPFGEYEVVAHWVGGVLVVVARGEIARGFDAALRTVRIADPIGVRPDGGES